MRNLLIILFALIISACQSSPPNQTAFSVTDLDKATWVEIEQKSRGTIVNFAMFAGDDVRNKYFQTKVATHLKEKFDIQLRIVPLGDTSEAINKLLNEKGVNKTVNGSIDMIWINGENFRTAKQAGILWGKFAEKLPNFKLYAADAGKTDFGTPIEGLEAPWQRGQFVLAYDSTKVSNPPKTFDELREFVKKIPENLPTLPRRILRVQHLLDTFCILSAVRKISRRF
ncbi:MAG: extracellular solute-binding protein [Blastocatellia bacterium]|nr:extracellular solute-binding protein [Blastocatellia bacterium]